MTDRPIIFSTPMVRALLDGRKTQSRRLLKPQPFPVGGPFYRPHPQVSPAEWQSISYAGHITNIQNVRFAPGDRLWVKEGCRRSPDLWAYEADQVEVAWPARREFATRERDRSPAMFMPRAASRLTLTVTDVRVQRLQEISEVDAIDEGALTVDLPAHGAPERTGRPPLGASPRERFQALWASIHGPKAWAENLWVVAISFDVERRNIDAMREAAMEHEVHADIG